MAARRDDEGRSSQDWRALQSLLPCKVVRPIDCQRQLGLAASGIGTLAHVPFISIQTFVMSTASICGTAGLPLPSGERVGVRGNQPLDRNPPPPTPPPCGEREQAVLAAIPVAPFDRNLLARHRSDAVDCLWSCAEAV